MARNIYSTEATLTLANPTAMGDVSLLAIMKACATLPAELAAGADAAFRIVALSLWNATPANAVLVAKTAAVGATHTTQIGGTDYPQAVDLDYPEGSALQAVGLAAAAGATVLVRIDFVFGAI